MTAARTRLTATERSEQVLRAAITAFSESGYTATKTDEIARLAGVSQPYVIRLFGNKQQLFLAATHRICDRIEDLFRAARAEAAPDASPQEALDAMGDGYHAFLAERELLQLFLHAFSASGDPAIGTDVRDRFGRIYHLVRELTGATADDAQRFIAEGMLLTVLSAIQVVGLDAVPTPWAGEIIDCFGSN
ncbi:TetR/AcrR family transcriptional regulator [Nocardia sp. NPDC051570]|uniref:TetR/AcrR family transcriptional regulator n=1 Tax=Nocardia sp. NPDC051570 TaxID=3364324 RepID=UPI003799F452